MSLQGPMVVVGDEACDLVDELARAGAFPIIETTWEGAASAIAEIEPAAVILTCSPCHSGGSAAAIRLFRCWNRCARTPQCPARCRSPRMRRSRVALRG